MLSIAHAPTAINLVRVFVAISAYRRIFYCLSISIDELSDQDPRSESASAGLWASQYIIVRDVCQSGITCRVDMLERLGELRRAVHWKPIEAAEKLALEKMEEI